MDFLHAKTCYFVISFNCVPLQTFWNFKNVKLPTTHVTTRETASNSGWITNRIVIIVR
jgi:hypothetical protein